MQLFFLLHICLASNAQEVTGRVLDKESNQPICFATVYFNGTFIGTSTDDKGYFQLNVKKSSEMPITISAIGYYSHNEHNYSDSIPLVIRLQPKIYELKDATVSAESLERKRRRYLRLFKEEFLGTTTNAEKCEILNEEDITFNYYSDKDTVKAFTSKPLVVVNRALGYKINYYLDKFEYYKKDGATFFTGNMIFEEDLSVAADGKQAFKHRRQASYNGSRMHFFRVLWFEGLEASAFRIRNTDYTLLSTPEIVQMDKSFNKFLEYSGKLLISYENSRSLIEFINSPVYFDKTGFFNPGIKWSGKMALQRVADWLPYEYKPSDPVSESSVEL